MLANVLETIFPTFTLKNGDDAQMFSRNPSVAEAYIKNPLVHPLVMVSWVKAMLRLIDLIYQNSPPLSPAPAVDAWDKR